MGERRQLFGRQLQREIAAGFNQATGKGGLVEHDRDLGRLAKVQHAGPSGRHHVSGVAMLYRLATSQDFNAVRTWDLGNCTINRLLWTPQGLRLVGWADTNHLEATGRDEATIGSWRFSRVGTTLGQSISCRHK